MTGRPRSCLIPAILILALLCAGQVLAQESRGTVLGVVKDASGGVVPGAEVTVMNKAMGAKTTVVTNDSGAYQVAYLNPGLYKITVEFPGFKTFVADDILVQVNDKLEYNVTLQVGEQTETITITGDAPLLNTATATMGQVVDSRRVADLPLAHGNPYALIGMAAGASFNMSSATLNRPFEPTHIVGYAINGARANRMDVMIDGVPSTATANQSEVIAAYVPPVDIVQEFKVQTANFDASAGNSEGGVTNISLKSGTNSLHGTAYWAKAPQTLAANEWASNKQGLPKPIDLYNRWGGSVGGPFYIPHLYDGRNKTFFMWGYEAIHETRPRNNCGGSCTVPTAANKTGNFSQQLAAGSQYQIYNPFTRVANSDGTYTSLPFDGNIIPPQLINPIAAKVLNDFYPAPISAGDAAGRNNMYDTSLPETITYYTHSFKVDQILNENQRLAVTARFYKRDSNYNNYLQSIATGEWFQFLSRAGGVDYVNTINASTVLNLRYGYNRFVRSSDGNPGSYGMDITTLGFPASFANLVDDQTRRFPGFTFPGGSNGTGYIGPRHDNFVRPIDTHVLAANLNKVFGTHSMKTGIEYRAYRENNRTAHSDITGRFDFTTDWTRGPLNTASGANSGTAQSMAAFLLGLPSAANSYVSRLATYAEQSTNWGVYLQDDWRVNDRLSLNIGLRWEYEGPMTERYDRSVRGFDSAASQAIEAAAVANYTALYNAQAGGANPLKIAPADFHVRGGLLFANVGGQPRGLYDTPKTDFLPQIGFAYKMGSKTVLRGGYGINYSFLGQRRSDVIQSGFSQNTNLVPTLDSGLTWLETLSNPFQGGIVAPVGAAQGVETFVGQGISFFNVEPDVPYNQRWTLGLQHQLPGSWVWDIAYVGNRGTSIDINKNFNTVPLEYLSRLTVRDDATNTYLTGNVSNPFYGLIPVTTSIGGSKNISRQNLLKPFPQFGDMNGWTNQGYSWYHSLQTGMQKRFSGDYSLAVNYTWSKFMQATEYLNAADPLPTETISDMDTPHRLSATGIWELPFGKGKKLGSGVNPWVNGFIGGWQVNLFYYFQSARPIGNWGNLIFTGDTKNISLGSAQTPDKWINTAAGFETDSKKQLASNVRTFPYRFSYIRSDYGNNWDISVMKNTAVAEGKNVQFRAEFLNALNNPNFGGPDLSPTSGTFGKVTGVFNYSRRIQISLKFIF